MESGELYREAADRIYPLMPTIQFIIPVEDADPSQATTTQGFAPSLLQNTGLIRQTAFFPSNIFELTPEGKEVFLAARMGGTNPIRWYPQSRRAINSNVTPPAFAFAILLLGQQHRIDDYADWLAKHQFPLTVVAERGGTFTYKEFTVEALQQHFLEICDALIAIVSEEALRTAKDAISRWKPLEPRSLGYQVKGHNSVIPNLMALSAAGYDDLVSGPFDDIGLSEGIKPYVDQIVRTAQSIREERNHIGMREPHNQFRCPPDLNLFAPSIYPHFFELSLPADEAFKSERKNLKMIQRVLAGQSGYKFELAGARMKAFADFDGEDKIPRLHPLISQRAAELTFGTDCIGTLAASELSAVLRLPNDVNRTAGQVRQFASHYRSENIHERKRLTAFRQVQKRISDSVPSEFVSLIDDSEFGIRVVADAHLEWLQINGLPLSLAKDTSRIPVTPGNLFVDQIGSKEVLHLDPEAFSEILLLSALRRDDPIKPAFDVALQVFGRLWADRLDVKNVEVSSEEELVNAINDFQGVLAIFDGHGSHSRNEPCMLHLMDTPIDVWQMRGRIERPPPIVVLSACDTHAADRNHATAGNGFLALGSRAVLSSVFPLRADQAATFTARLLYRVSDFVPSAFKVFGRSFSWLEIVSGMLRMQLLTDFLRLLLKRKLIDEANYQSIGERGNMVINSLSDRPFEHIIELAAEETRKETGEISRLLEIAIAHSSAISYLHLGRPETIIIHPSEKASGVRESA
jgi:hypothetical protein